MLSSWFDRAMTSKVAVFFFLEKALYSFWLIHEKLKDLRAKSLIPDEAGGGMSRNVRLPSPS